LFFAKSDDFAYYNVMISILCIVTEWSRLLWIPVFKVTDTFKGDASVMKSLFPVYSYDKWAANQFQEDLFSARISGRGFFCIQKLPLTKFTKNELKFYTKFGGRFFKKL